tara:strand:+ start:273844 stop:275280 length:1437 start_codon:yes stop_codon:yes gene_type:complete
MIGTVEEPGNVGADPMRTWQALKSSWRNRGLLGNGNLGIIQRHFLPAALEVQESPPSPASHWLLGLLLCLFVIGVLWASFGQVDIVVTAPGRIVPSGQVKQVQAPQAGTISAILVNEGGRVEEGQALVRLDPTYADADEQRVREQLDDTVLEIHWRKALEDWLRGGREGGVAMTMPRHMNPMELAGAATLYGQHRQEISARMLSLEKELAANGAEQATARAERLRTRATLAVLVERVAAYKTLVDKQYGARVQYLEMLQQQTELERSIPVLISREQQLVENAAAITARRNASLSELRKHNLMKLVRLSSERSALEQESRKVQKDQSQLLLLAPVTGTVQELVTHTIGGVVSPAQVLMKIVPENATIEVEALLQNKDIGFVNAGQLAEVKVDTFNFTKYGLIDAKIENVSNDVVEDQQLGWVFKMRLKLDRDSITVEDKLVRLSPGMSVTTEIKTGERRLIEFFLSPLLRYKQESVRER